MPDFAPKSMEPIAASRHTNDDHGKEEVQQVDYCHWQSLWRLQQALSWCACKGRDWANRNSNPNSWHCPRLRKVSLGCVPRDGWAAPEEDKAALMAAESKFIVTKVVVRERTGQTVQSNGSHNSDSKWSCDEDCELVCFFLGRLLSRFPSWTIISPFVGVPTITIWGLSGQDTVPARSHISFSAIVSIRTFRSVSFYRTSDSPTVHDVSCRQVTHTSFTSSSVISRRAN